jgi:hypothetical protein
MVLFPGYSRTIFRAFGFGYLEPPRHPVKTQNQRNRNSIPTNTLNVENDAGLPVSSLIFNTYLVVGDGLYIV